MIRPSALHHTPRGTRTRRIRASVALLTAVAWTGCGGSADRSGDAAGLPSARPASPASLQTPAAPKTAGALALVPDGRAARTRVGYADAARLQAADLPLPAATVTAAVLGDARGTIAIGTARRRFVAGDKPQTSVITPIATSAVQACLGDTLAQTILGPAAMGDDAAVGTGLAVSGDAPKGVQLRVCAAPRLIRHLHASERVLERRFGGVRGTVVAGSEIGEREIVTATVAARRLAPRDVRAILAGGSQLTALAPWR